uniref:Uncharacterized protein n=2 Tax=Picea TaxID=3328 RepID=A0A117NGH1_PICGL|nr:hypothetical protein ABT39_MTgene6248 [Picea glauca]QHR92629.1 hypothetical protein Q903MT_gene6676 [Picea sitchensis]
MLPRPLPMILYRGVSLSWTEVTMALDAIRVEWSQHLLHPLSQRWEADRC